MDDKKFSFWQKWLTYANGLTILVGLLVAFAGDSFVFQLHNQLTQKHILNGTPYTAEILNLKTWLFGICGGTIVGYHILMIYISEYAFKKKEKWAYKALWLSLITWFFIDSSISLYTNAIHNIIMINLVALFIIGLPLLMTRKAFVT